MKKIFIAIITMAFIVFSETLFEVKDSANNKVLDVSTDGIAVMNLGDTLMVISTTEIKAVIDDSKVLSRKFSVSTTSAKKGQYTDLFDVSLGSATMRESAGNRYTDFGPKNIFMGLNSGLLTTPDGIYGIDNLFIGNSTGYSHTTGTNNIFVGSSAGYITNYGSRNIFIGVSAGYNNKTGGDNVYIGTEAGKGYQSGTIFSNGDANVSIGVNSGHTIKTGFHNVFSGYWSGYNTTDGDDNVFLGSLSGFKNSTQNSNVYLGFASGASNAGDKNVMIGSGDNDHLPPTDAAMSGSVFIGFGAGTYETLSNRLYIENSAADKNNSLIYGEFDNNVLTFNTTKTIVNHELGTTNGLYIQNAAYSNNWHFYQYSTGGLYLYYNGIQRGTWNTTTGVYTSYAKEMKDSVDDVGFVIDKVMKLQPKRYNFVSQKAGEMKYIGLIAQDVLEIFPEFVYYNEEDKSYSIDYSGLSVVAIQAIKEQQSEIDYLKVQIEELRELIKK